LLTPSWKNLAIWDSRPSPNRRDDSKLDRDLGNARDPRFIAAIWLDRRESAVIAIALLPSEQEAKVVLDDPAARGCASVLGLKVRVSVSFLLLAKAKGRIPLVQPLIEERRRGRHASFRQLAWTYPRPRRWVNSKAEDECFLLSSRPRSPYGHSRRS
jgi:hypothetical protein